MAIPDPGFGAGFPGVGGIGFPGAGIGGGLNLDISKNIGGGIGFPGLLGGAVPGWGGWGGPYVPVTPLGALGGLKGELWDKNIKEL